ncbi:MAG: hypothetical protein IT292_01095 [Deltaproteobacteria bacterium]|nr:hypothetical protein [Deltaproteobacteria bacterium]
MNATKYQHHQGYILMESLVGLLILTLGLGILLDHFIKQQRQLIAIKISTLNIRRSAQISLNLHALIGNSPTTINSINPVIQNDFPELNCTTISGTTVNQCSLDKLFPLTDQTINLTGNHL